MNVVLRPIMTLEQFLAWEELQELRYEFDGREPIEMTGGTLGHDRITFLLRLALERALGGSVFHAHGPNVKIIVDRKIRYPDAVITGSRTGRRESIVADPVVVFEVLSESTSRTDRIEKLREYQATPSILRYVILEQDSVAAAIFARAGDAWIASALTEADVLDLPEVAISIPLAECYAGLFPAPAETEPGATTPASPALP